MESKVIKGMIFISNIIYLFGIFFLFFNKLIVKELLFALLFAQVLVMGILMFNYILYKKFKKLSEQIGFDYISSFFEQPRMEGMYKKNWWQLHFKQMERGEFTGMLRTYVKLQWKDEKKFNHEKLNKYRNYNYGDQKIISIEHITRTYKNYLLLKRSWYTVDKKKLHSLMDLLLKVAKESEIK